MSTLTERPADAMPEDPADFEQLAARVDAAAAELQTLDPESRAKAVELQRAIESFHRLALTTMVRRLRDDDRGRELLFELAERPEVYAMFTLHGIVRAELRVRVSRVIEGVRPYMQSHGGDVELLDVDAAEHRVVVRLHGACHGCSMSAVTLRNGVEEALREQIPETLHLEVAAGEPAAELVKLESRRPAWSREGWTAGPPLDAIADSRPHRLDAGGMSIIIVRHRDNLQAFRNVCAHEGLPLDGASVDPGTGILTCPWHGYRFDSHTGECLTTPQVQLESIPLRVEDGVVWVRSVD